MYVALAGHNPSPEPVLRALNRWETYSGCCWSVKELDALPYGGR